MYSYIKKWKTDYARPGMPDQRALWDFIECETGEVLRSLQSELMGVSQGKYKPDAMNVIVGSERIQRHGSYEEWAKLMLTWISSYKH